MSVQRFIFVGAMTCMAGSALGIDHGNLDEGRPLRIEDAYTVSSGELVLELGTRFHDHRQRDDQWLFPVELLWGAAPNLQIGLGSAIFTDPHDVDDQHRSGDLRLSGLYNFNQETWLLPALAVKAQLNLPTGVDSQGVDGEMTGIITKSIGRLSFHFNAGYEFLSGTADDEDDGVYKFALGASLPLGAPMHTRTVLLADVFMEEAPRRGEDDVIGAEVGVRVQLTERIVLDAGVGSEFDGPDDRSRLFATLGLSITF